VICGRDAGRDELEGVVLNAFELNKVSWIGDF
jgi:hypothetical protein